MILRISSWFLILLGLTGSFYFDHYKGTLIARPLFWFWGCIVVVLGGIYLLMQASQQAGKNIAERISQEQQWLKEKGEAMLLTMETCVIKQQSYQQEVISSATRVQMADALYDPARNHTTIPVCRSVIIFRPGGVPLETFISPSYAMDETTLAYHIMMGHITLYVDRFDRKKYWFDWQAAASPNDSYPR